MDLIQYDKECNYLDLRIRNSHGMLDKCIKDKNNVLKGDTCNLSNSELNSINEVTMKNMNENVYQVFIDNNLSNITDEPLNISLGENANDTNIKKDMDKDNNLNIYPKDVENNVFKIGSICTLLPSFSTYISPDTTTSLPILSLPPSITI